MSRRSRNRHKGKEMTAASTSEGAESSLENPVPLHPRLASFLLAGPLPTPAPEHPPAMLGHPLASQSHRSLHLPGQRIRCTPRLNRTLPCQTIRRLPRPARRKAGLRRWRRCYHNTRLRPCPLIPCLLGSQTVTVGRQSYMRSSYLLLASSRIRRIAPQGQVSYSAGLIHPNL
jgi:hypothetical protein